MNNATPLAYTPPHSCSTPPPPHPHAHKCCSHRHSIVLYTPRLAALDPGHRGRGAVRRAPIGAPGGRAAERGRRRGPAPLHRPDEGVEGAWSGGRRHATRLAAGPCGRAMLAQPMLAAYAERRQPRRPRHSSAPLAPLLTPRRTVGGPTPRRGPPLTKSRADSSSSRWGPLMLEPEIDELRPLEDWSHCTGPRGGGEGGQAAEGGAKIMGLQRADGAPRRAQPCCYCQRMRRASAPARARRARASFPAATAPGARLQLLARQAPRDKERQVAPRGQPGGVDAGAGGSAVAAPADGGARAGRWGARGGRLRAAAA